MKTSLLSRLLPALGSALFAVPNALAEGIQPPDNMGLSTSVTDVNGMIGKIVNWGLEFVATLAVAYIVFQGFRLVTSNGEEGAMDKAKKGILYAVIGLVIIALAAVIVNVALNLVN